MSDIHSILKKYWGYDTFRPQQEAIIRSVLDGNDTLALLPTGGGKSICYQVPALAADGICLVISPLIALMKDQVESLKKRGIGALVIYSGMQRKDIIRTLENARSAYFKFLYVSPERLETSLFLEYLPALNVNLIAVDEAHCISQWGYDFRPSYLRIADLRKELQEVPVLAVTASATEDVEKDICAKLSPESITAKSRTREVLGAEISTTEGWNIFRQSFERPNLSFSAFKVDSKINKLVNIVKNVYGSGIVYCKSRKRTNEIANLLQMHGISAANYHAGLQQEERSKRQQQWIESKTRIIVCTNAFGMGIDKPDVRFVVHADVPDCIENYYQEAGRAGRDGVKAYAVLLYDDQDLKELTSLHLQRFPSFEKIKEVYSALCNFLQVPVNSGQDVSYDFRFDEFVRNFKLDLHTALYSLKALEQDGWIAYNEKSFIPSTVVFTTSKNALYDFYASHPEVEEVSTALLRTYDGIFDFPAFISESLLALLIRKDLEEVKRQLHLLSSFNVVNYVAQNDQPQLIFRKNRVATHDLTVDLKTYNKRKNLFIECIEKIIKYAEYSDCRSTFIRKYFGDDVCDACGICDNCLRRKKSGLSTSEFSSIASSIFEAIANETCTTEELLKKLGTREKTWTVLQFLQTEKKIVANARGQLSIVKVVDRHQL